MRFADAIGVCMLEAGSAWIFHAPETFIGEAFGSDTAAYHASPR